MARARYAIHAPRLKTIPQQSAPLHLRPFSLATRRPAFCLPRRAVGRKVMRTWVRSIPYRFAA